MELHDVSYGIDNGLEVGSIRRIQGVGYDVLEFLGVGTTFDIFQNIHMHGYAVSSLMDTAYWSSEYPEKRHNLETSANLTRAEPGKCSRETDMSKDTPGPESPEGLQRSWYVEGQIRSGVVSSVLAQQYQETVQQRCRTPCHCTSQAITNAIDFGPEPSFNRPATLEYRDYTNSVADIAP
ncbi:hypothetical protein Tco_1183613 [Tanacetum coccineum]